MKEEICKFMSNIAVVFVATPILQMILKEKFEWKSLSLLLIGIILEMLVILTIDRKGD